MKLSMERIRHRGAFVHIIMVTLLVSHTSIYTTLWLELPSDSWMDDDSNLFALAKRAPSFLSFFSDREFIRYGAGNQLTPFQVFSYWSDLHLFGINPQYAYLHQCVSLVFVVLLLYAVLVSLSRKPIFSCVSVISWLFLASTQATVEFLSTRHYLEGLGVSLLATYFFMKGINSQAKKSFVWLLLAGSLCAVALLFKEIYVATLLPFCFFASLYKKRFGWSASFACIGVLYIIGRISFLGFNLKYGSSYLGFVDYSKFILRLPYLLFGNFGSYLVVALIFLNWKQFRKNTAVNLVFFFLLFASLLTIFPVAGPVKATWLEPGTWYRAVFLLNTFVWFWFCWSFSDIRWHKSSKVLAAAALLSLGWGTWKTRTYWDHLKAWYLAEQTFLSSVPSDGVFVSTVPAYWFLGGIQELYNISSPPFLLSANSEKLIASAADSKPFYVYDKGVIRKSPAFQACLLEEKLKESKDSDRIKWKCMRLHLQH